MTLTNILLAYIAVVATAALGFIGLGYFYLAELSDKLSAAIRALESIRYHVGDRR